MFNHEKRMAEKVCKRLKRGIELAIVARPRGPGGGYTTLQGYRTALGLCAAACFELGMTEDEVARAVSGAIDGYKSTQQQRLE